MANVFYLCDGKKDCNKKNCYKNGGRCKHTKDIGHAKNFEKRLQRIKQANFWEKVTASENQMQL